MITANISKTKNELSRYLDAVRAGETVLILDRKTPVARIEPINRSGELGHAVRLADLEAGGLITRGAGGDKKWPTRLGAVEGVSIGSVGAVEALLEERASGR